MPVLRSRRSSSPLKCLPKKIELKSLEDIWLGVFLTIIQILCIKRACNYFKTFNTATWEPFTRPSFELSIYITFIFLSVILLPVFAFTSIFKISSYANDNLQLGKDLDPQTSTSKKQRRTSNRSSSQNTRYSLMPGITNSQTNIKTAQPFSTSSVLSNSYSETTSGTVRSSKSILKNRFLSKLKIMFSLKHAWKNLPPISSLMHLTTSFILLVPEVLLIAKEIQYGLRPKGFVHHSQMDFIFKRPLDRFSESQTFLDPSPFYFDNVNLQQPNEATTTNQVNYYMSKSQIKIQLISSSLDDTDQVNYTPQVSLEFFSYLLALAIMVLRYSRPLWTLNKAYAFLFSVHLIFIAILYAISFSAFEILYKFQSCFSSGIKLKLTSQQEQIHNATSEKIITNQTNINPFSQVVFNLPFATSPAFLLLAFISSIILLALSAVPIYAYAIFLYRLKLKKFQAQLKRHLPLIGKAHQQKQSQQCFYEETKILYSASSTTGDTTDQGVYLQDSPSPVEPLLDSKKTEKNETGQFPNFNSSNPPPLPSEPPPNPTKALSESDITNTSSSSSSSTISLENSSISQQTIANIINTETTNAIITRTKMPFFAIYAPYKPHIFALIILLALCIHTALVVYDLICLYQLTSDTVPFWAALCHIGFILWYIFVWLLLTFKTNWSVEFTSGFKLALWSDITNKIISRNESSICSSSADSFKRKIKQPSLNKRQSNMVDTYHTEYNELESGIARGLVYSSHRKLLKPSSLSMSNLAHASSQNSEIMLQQRQSVNETSHEHEIRNNVFSSSGLLVSDKGINSNYGAEGCGEYDTDITPYENFNTMTSMSEKSKTFSSSNINNSNKSSIRRLNHQISSEQQRRLAPVFENSGPFNSNVHKLRNQFNVDTNTNLNQQLFFLRKNLNKTYETAAEVCKDMPTQTANGKSSESIYKSKGSLMGSNYNSICELEKRAGSILMNKNFSPKDKQINLVPLHIAQQHHDHHKRTSSGAETSPKSQSDSLSSSNNNTTANLNQINETDSGRHSMSDSPPTLYGSNSGGVINIKTSPGTFTSNVRVLNTGSSIGINQTSLRLRQTNESTAKKARSVSRDQVMTKSCSFSKNGLPPISSGHSSVGRSASGDRRSHGIGKVGSSGNINVTNGTLGSTNTKQSSSSINRICSDL